MESQKIKNVEHFVFDTVLEFNHHFRLYPNPPEIKHDWRTANEGDWVWSDDGRIVQIIRKKSMQGAHSQPPKVPRFFIRTVVGTFINYPNAQMDTDFSKHASRYTFGGKNACAVDYVPKCKLTTKERLWILQMIRGLDPFEAYESVFGPAKRSYIMTRVCRLLSEARILRTVQQEMKDAFKEAGIEFKSILQVLNTFIQDPQVAGQARLEGIRLLISEFKESARTGNSAGFIGDGGPNSLADAAILTDAKIEDARVAEFQDKPKAMEVKDAEGTASETGTPSP